MIKFVLRVNFFFRVYNLCVLGPTPLTDDERERLQREDPDKPDVEHASTLPYCKWEEEWRRENVLADAVHSTVDVQEKQLSYYDAVVGTVIVSSFYISRI